MTHSGSIELLAPAGGPEAFNAALAAGAVIAICALLKLKDEYCFAVGLVVLFVASYFTQQMAYKEIVKKYENSK